MSLKTIKSFFNEFNPEQKKVLFLSSLGGVLEYYDFVIYIFLAPIIEKVFFADNSLSLATLKTLAIFSIGYLLRPLGGLFFSHLGDRYGRKVVFLMTVLFMAVPSLVIGLLPTPNEIGLFSPLILLACRMMQGLALGGEIPASITFVAEHTPSAKRGFSLAILFFGINLGLLLGSFVTSIFTAFFSTTELVAYAWRIPFLIGGIFGLISIFIRRYLRETTAFLSLKPTEIKSIPFISLIRFSFKNVMIGTLLVSLGSVSVFLFLYWPHYLSHYFQYNYADIVQLNTIAILVLNISILLGGILSDRYGFRYLYLLCSIFLIVFTYPLFLLFGSYNMTLVVSAYLIFSFVFGFIPSCYSSLLTELFPTSIRYSGIATSYNLAFAFFGGLSPIICTLAIDFFSTVYAPALYIIIISLFAGFSCYRGILLRPIQKTPAIDISN